MRTHSTSSSRLARALLVAVSFVVVAGCGGGSSGTNPIPNPGSSNFCDPNNQGIQIARYTASTSTIEIVANGQSDQLFQSFAQFDLNLIDNGNNRFATGPLSLTTDQNGPHPYTSDFYYNGVVQGGLPFGDFFNVYLNAPQTNCTLLPIGQLQT